jgi:hypothetical protein
MRRSQKDLPNYHGPDPRGGTPVTHHSWAAVPALTVLCLLRYPVGNKVASPGTVIIVAAFMYFAAPWVSLFICGLLGMQSLPPNLGTGPLAAFAIACAAACALVWAWRLLRLGRAGSVHQQEAGYSWPARLIGPLPLWLSEIFVVPGAVGLAGWYVFNGPSLTLGAWLMMCGASLALMGFAELRHRISVSGSVTDLHSQGQAAGASLGNYAAPTSASGAGRRTIAEAANPTGMAMQAEGGGGRPGLFLFSFRKRNGRRAKREAAPTYAEPG